MLTTLRTGSTEQWWRCRRTWKGRQAKHRDHEAKNVQNPITLTAPHPSNLDQKLVAAQHILVFTIHIHVILKSNIHESMSVHMRRPQGQELKDETWTWASSRRMTLRASSLGS